MGLTSLLGLPEDYDLDYKRQRYGTGSQAAKDAAVDVAAFANATGGLLIIGIEEEGTGVASALAADTAPDDLGLWINQVVAARVSPTPTIGHASIPVSGGSAHIISVAPSTRKPHAVSVGNDTLRFPIRSGTTTRYMSEPEIADLYYRRLTGAIKLESQITTLHESATSLLGANERLEDQAWLILSAIPSSPGDLELEAGIAEQWIDWVRPALRHFPTHRGQAWQFADRYLSSASVGFRSIVLSDGSPDDFLFYSVLASLRLDGSGFIAFGHPGTRNIHEDASEIRDVYDEHIVSDVIHGLGVLSNHAIRTGATGDLSIGSQFRSDRSMALFQYRYMQYGQLANTRAVDHTTPLALRSTPIEAPSVLGPDLMALARSILTDLFSSFGLSHPHQITADNQLDVRHFYRDRFGQFDIRKNLGEWASNAGIESIGAPG